MKQLRSVKSFFVTPKIQFTENDSDVSITFRVILCKTLKRKAVLAEILGFNGFHKI